MRPLGMTGAEGSDTMDTNFSNPEGDEGIERLKGMNEHHRPLSEWALSSLPDISPGSILDIGCGGGMMISLLSERYPKAKIAGIDISKTAVEYAREYNEGLISSGRCRIDRASVESIPYSDCMFDLVVSCESYFFWPDLVQCLGEACRVVSLGGRIVIISEAYPHPDFDEVNREHAERYGMRLRSNNYMKALIGSFGFDVDVMTVEEKNWVIFVGRRTSFSSF